MKKGEERSIEKISDMKRREEKRRDEKESESVVEYRENKVRDRSRQNRSIREVRRSEKK